VKILVVAASLPPDHWSGTGRALRDFARFSRAHHEVRLVAGFRHERGMVPPEAIAVDQRGRSAAGARFALISSVVAEARRFRPDALISGTVLLPPLGIPQATLLHDLRLPEAHGRRWLFRKISDLSARLITTSVEAARALARLGVREERIRVVPGAVDTAEFHPRDDTVAKIPGVVQLLCAGRILPAKGQHHAIDAVARLPPELKSRVELVIGGAVADPVYLDQLRVQAWGQPVRFELDPPRMAPLLRNADVLLLPSIVEAGFSTTAVEGMASGCPVIWADRAAMREATGGFGLAVPPDDSGALRAALMRWIRDPAERSAAAMDGLRFVDAHRSWERVLPVYETLLRELVSIGR
jgi:glycosyltransferase involved in cell wall biosynthesis